MLTRSALATCALLASVSLPSAMAQTPRNGSLPRPTIGLALEGGGALALAHVGVIEWFEQHHIPIDYIAGTSMGGLVGGFYASGMTAPEMRQRVNDLDWDKLVNGEVDFKRLAFRQKEDDRALGNSMVFGLRHGLVLSSGLNSGQALDLLLSEISLPYGTMKSFDDLPVPFRCVATDLAAAKQQVFDRGPLDQALRATMSIPGYYDPALIKPAGGKELREYVDGGLLNNLPVDLVKAMGADIVIAVYLSRDPYIPNAPHTALDVLSRSVVAVSAANERRNIEMADMLVPVNLAGFSATDFSQAQEIMDRGIEGAEKRKNLLGKFALDDATWRSYMEQRQSKRRTSVVAPEFLTIEGLDGLGGGTEKDRILAGQIRTYFADQIGKPMDRLRVEAQIRKIMGMGVVGYMSYAAIERDGKPGLAIYVRRSNSRPPTLQPALGLDGSDYLRTRLSAGARLTIADFGGFRSALRTDLVIGSEYGIRSEYFHPVSPLSNWFIAPRAYAQDQPLEFYHRSRIVALDRERKAGGGVDLGYSIGNTGEVRAGYEAGYVASTFRVGAAAAFPIVSGRYGATRLSYSFDRVDDEIVPHSGLQTETSLRWVDANPGSARHFRVFDGRGAFFQPFGVLNTAFFSAEGGTVFNADKTGLPLYFLGGPQRLSAYGMNELFGNEYFLGRMGVLKQVRASTPFTDGRLYIFADYEVARMYGSASSTALPMDVNAGLLVRTPLGALSVGGSIGDAGHRKWYFQMGRFF